MVRVVYRARWVMPVSSPPIADARLVVDGERLVSVEPARAPVPGEIDLGDVAVLPGFVNAHTHLELTACRGCVPLRDGFVQWLEDLVSQRVSQDAEALSTSVDNGLRESAAGGITLLADIAGGPDAPQLWQHAPVSVVGFLEVVGMGPKRHGEHAQSFDHVQARCRRLPDLAARPVGLSPHAPYSTAPELYRRAITFARSAGRPLSTHLAESREELQFLADGRGPLRDLLERWGLWDGSFEPPGCSPVEYAEQLGLLACEPVLAHVNVVGPRDLDLLAARHAHVVYCPRSHAFFDHDPHPYPDMLARGINVCIGTDSLASNTSLSILQELRFLHERDPHLNVETLLNMGTLAGARALGCEATRGSLQPGKRADWVAVPLAEPTTRRPAEDVLNSDHSPNTVCVGGHCLPF